VTVKCVSEVTARTPLLRPGATCMNPKVFPDVNVICKHDWLCIKLSRVISTEAYLPRVLL
jgi:hypothetical protein